VRFRDGAGRELPFQQGAGGVYWVSLPAVPALGYQTLSAVEQPAPSLINSQAAVPGAAVLRVDYETHIVENDLISVKINADGSLDVTDKIHQVHYPGLALFEDGGDAGDTYNYSFPKNDRILTDFDQPAEIMFLESGPLRACIQIRFNLLIPQGLAPDRNERSSQTCRLPVTTWVTIEANSPLVKFHTQVSNTARNHRLRVLFPSGIDTTVSHAETQFDVVTRPIHPERYDDSSIPENVKQVIIGAREPEPVTIFPQRTFVDLNDGRRGLAVLNQGLPEYEILPDQNTIALTLFRGVDWIARPDLLTRIGDAGPLIAVPGAQCLRNMSFDYAVLAHGGDWQGGQVVEAADHFNSRLLVVETGAHSGALAPSGGFLGLVDPSRQLKVTAVKRSEDGRALVVRLHNPTSQKITAQLETAFAILTACYANLAEDCGEPIPALNPRRLAFSAGPKKIITLRLEIGIGNTMVAQAREEISLHNPEAEWRGGSAEIELPPAISLEDIARESARADELETILVEKERVLQSFLALGAPEDAAAILKMYQLKLDAASFRRTTLEARLSATLMNQNYWKDMPAERRSAANPALPSFEAILRQIGDAINTARVEKRALEYVVDYYSKQIS
jgi:mannosylglycerate hydrolase